VGLQTWVQAWLGYPIPNIRTPNTSHSFPSSPPIQNLFCWQIANFFGRADSIRSRGFQVKSQHWRSALTLSVILTFYDHFNLYDWVIRKLLASLLSSWVVIDSKLVKGSWQRSQGHEGKQDMNEACCLDVAATLPRDISLVTLYLVCNVWFCGKLKYAIEDLSGVYLHEGISTLTSWKVLTTFCVVWIMMVGLQGSGIEEDGRGSAWCTLVQCEPRIAQRRLISGVIVWCTRSLRFVLYSCLLEVWLRNTKVSRWIALNTVHLPRRRGNMSR
jgi:hypothetical protein